MPRTATDRFIHRRTRRVFIAARLGAARWHSKGPPDDGQVGERGRGLTIVLTPAIITGKTRSNISGNSAVILRGGELPAASPAEFLGGEAALNGTRIRGMHSEKFEHAARRSCWICTVADSIVSREMNGPVSSAESSGSFVSVPRSSRRTTECVNLRVVFNAALRGQVALR